MSTFKNIQELCKFGIVTALPKEFAAMCTMLDNVQSFHVAGDPSDYAVGTIPWKHGRGEHYVVISLLKKMGNNSAAATATHLLRSFRNVNNIIMMGIAYGMPNIQKSDKHVRLGDIVVSKEHGVIQADNIKITDNEIKNRDSSNKPSALFIGKINVLEAQRLSKNYPWEEYIERAKDLEDAGRPDESEDVLFSSLQPGQVISHPVDEKRRLGKPKLHYGRIASANTLMSNGIARDELRDRLDVIAGEMEGSGIADATWVDGKWYILIRGICDYGDGSKKDKWQGYASVVAAAYTRALIEICEIEDDHNDGVRLSGGQPGTNLSEGMRSSARAVAEELLKLFSPISVASLLGPSAQKANRLVAELSKVERTISSPMPASDAYYALEHTPIHLPDSKKTSSFALSQLLIDREKQHILIAHSGAGKTHALMLMCRQALNAQKLLPIFIDISIFSNANEVIKYIESHFKLPLDILTNELNAVFVFDNWGKFILNNKQESDIEWRKLLGRLLGARVIIVAHTDIGRIDSFKVWNLDPLPDWTIQTILTRALPGSSPPLSSVLNLLRLPLLLILYGVMDSSRVSAGALLDALHRHLMTSIGVSEDISKILEIASASITMEGSKSFSNLKAAIQRHSHDIDASNILNILEQRGILRSVSGTIYPLHDLYWDFLVGRGIFQDGSLFASAITNLRTRKSIKLALESGASSTLAHASAAIDYDIVLAARIIASININREDKAFATVRSKVLDKIETLNRDDSIENRYRSLLAAIEVRDQRLLDLVFTTLSFLESKRYPDEDPLQYIESDFLWECRDLLETFLKDPLKRQIVLRAIEESADVRWVNWLEKVYLSQLISASSAVRIALHCTSELPFWVSKILSGKLQDIDGGYTIGSVALRRVNPGLANWVVLNYERLLEGHPRNDASFVHLNRVLLNSGEDTYNLLLNNFTKWSDRSQTRLSLCIKSMDSAWVARFQSVAFKNGYKASLSELTDIVCEETSDEDVELWLASSDPRLQALGWQTLVRKKQKDAIPRLLADLPASLGDLHLIPPLGAIRFLKDAPNELLDELWKRLSGTIMPATLEDFLYAVMSIYPNGVPSLVGFLKQNPFFMGIYHLGRFLQGLARWEADTGITFMYQRSGQTTSFGEWIVATNYVKEPNSPFFPQLFRTYSPARLSDFLLNAYIGGDTVAQELVTKFERVGVYHEGLVNHLQAQKEDSGLWKILNLFKNKLHTFPEEKLREILDLASQTSASAVSQLLQSILVDNTSMSSDFRIKLARASLLNPPISFDEQARIAKFLAVLPKTQILMTFKDIPMKNVALFVLRRIEKILGYALINEDGQFL